MSEQTPDRRLVSISTLWSVVFEAHGAQAEAAQGAQRQLLQRYGGAVRRYLRTALRDEDAADELYQEFAVSFLGGSFKNADPDKGRFRDYLRTALIRLINRHRQRDQRRPRPLGAELPEPAVEPEVTDQSDEAFLASWREELLARCWAALAQAEEQGGPAYNTVLRFRGEHPELRSPELAEQLSARLGRALSAASVRQLLHRARERFAELLVDEVAQSLADPTEEQLVGELVVLGLYTHCEPILQKRQAGR